MLQVNTMVLIIMVVLVTYRVHADPSISTSTPTPCYGDVVTLVCHHPELTSNRSRYFNTVPTWKEDGVGITPSIGVYIQAVASEDLTRTTLTINITVDHFRNKSFNYSCLLVIAENGLPTGEVETSGEVTVDPVDQLPIPRRVFTFSNSTTAVLTVSFDPRCCNTAQLTVDITTTSSSATTPVVHSVDSTDPTNTEIVITDVTEGVCYTASIQSVCEDNNLLKNSESVIVNFMTIGPPEVTATTGSTITLTWNTTLRCFESEMFTFVVIWNETGSGTSTNVTTSSSPYTISGLQPGTSYQISVLVVGESGVTSRTTVHNVATLAETPTGGGYLATIVAIATVAVPVVALPLLLVAIVIAIVPVVAHCWKTRTHTGFRARREDLPTSAEEINPPDNDSKKKNLMAIVHETRPLLTDDQRVKRIFPRLINDDSESDDLPTSEQVMNILSNRGSCTPSFELFGEASRDGESSIGKRKNGGGAASFQKPLPRREGSKDSAQDVEENALTKWRKFISKICEKVDKASHSKWTIRGAWLLVIIGILTYCGPGSPESHLTTNTPDSHLSMKTYQTMWKLVITCNWGGNEMEEVPKSSYVIFFTEQDIQDEANLERLLNQILWMILQKDTMPHCHSTRHLQSAGTKTTNHYASLPNIFVQN